MKKHSAAKAAPVTETDEGGRAVLSMTVRSDESFLSPFSSGHAPVISSELADFIEKKAAPLAPAAPLSLYIYSDCVEKEEEAPVYEAAIREYFSQRHRSAAHTLKRNHLVAAILALFGVLALAVTVLLELYVQAPIWTEVVDIVAWVLLWESVDVSLFRNYSLRIEKRRARALSLMPIRFFPEKRG